MIRASFEDVKTNQGTTAGIAFNVGKVLAFCWENAARSCWNRGFNLKHFLAPFGSQNFAHYIRSGKVRPSRLQSFTFFFFFVLPFADILVCPQLWGFSPDFFQSWLLYKIKIYRFNIFSVTWASLHIVLRLHTVTSGRAGYRSVFSVRYLYRYLMIDIRCII